MSCGLCSNPRALCTRSISGGELFDKILSKGKFSEEQARGLFQQIMLGISYMHSRGIAHRDLKPENILLNRISDRQHGRYIVKITDFGISRSVAPEALMHTFTGTMNYIGTRCSRLVRADSLLR